MRKFITAVFLHSFLGFWFIVSFFVFVNIPAIKAEDNHTVEGEWEVFFVSSDTENSLIGNKVLVVRTGDSYEVKRAGADSLWSCTGNDRRIVHTELEDLINPTDAHEGNAQPPFVAKKFASQKVPINIASVEKPNSKLVRRKVLSRETRASISPSLSNSSFLDMTRTKEPTKAITAKAKKKIPNFA